MTFNYNPRIFYSSIFLFFLFSSCKNDDNYKINSKDAVNITTIYADEICRDLLEAEKVVFESQNKNSIIDIRYGDEKYAVNNFFKDTSRIVALIRPFANPETTRLQSDSYSSKSIKIAEDALVCITKDKNKRNTLQTDSLSNYLNKNLAANKLLFVILKSQNAHIQYLQAKFKITPSQLNVYAVADSTAMFDYLKNNINSIGLIPLSWVQDNLTINSNKNAQLKILSLTDAFGKESMPDQENLVRGNYPLSKGIYLNVRGTKSDEASKFINFCTSDIGQLIVLKSNLLPVDMPSRVLFNNAK